MHPIQKLWNVAAGLQKANVEYQVLSTRLEEARTKLGIDDNFDIIRHYPE